MAIDYEAAKRSFRKQKAALTRARKKGPQAVIDAVNAAYAEWNALDIPFPDGWRLWENAKRDAELELRRAAW